jgi:hypothetical protein
MQLKKLKSICAISCLCFFYCCNTKVELHTEKGLLESNRIFVPTYKALLPNKKFDSIVLTFIKENPCDSCIQEMYFDKVYPAVTYIILKERPYSKAYLRDKNPLFTISYAQKKFYVYCGLEDVFTGDKKLIDFHKDTNNKTFVKWEIKIDSDIYTVNKKYEGMPFFPNPTQTAIPKITGIKMIK